MVDQLSEWLDSVITSVYRDSRPPKWPERLDYDTPPTETEREHIQRRSKAGKRIAATHRIGLFSKKTNTGRKRSAKVRRERFWGDAVGWVINPQKQLDRRRTFLSWSTRGWLSQLDETTENLESIAESLQERRKRRRGWRR